MATLKRTQDDNVRPEIKEAIENIPSQARREYIYTPQPQKARKDKTQLLVKYFGELRDDQKKGLFDYLFDNNIGFELRQPLF